ncbi:MAG: BACON domain-containing protein [Victivallales bacterium]|nr:BACON domain-containing protein [Victivallales bacterium]
MTKLSKYITLFLLFFSLFLFGASDNLGTLVNSPFVKQYAISVPARGETTYNINFGTCMMGQMTLTATPRSVVKTWQFLKNNTVVSSGSQTTNTISVSDVSAANTLYSLKVTGLNSSSSEYTLILDVAITVPVPIVTSEMTFTSEGGTQSLEITGANSWTATSDSAWLTLSAASGTTTYPTVTAAAYEGNDPRTGTITIYLNGNTAMPRTCTVTQAGEPATLLLDPVSFTLDANHHQEVVYIGTNADWSLAVDSDWVTPEVTNGSGDYFLPLSISANTSASQRTAHLTFSAPDCEDAVCTIRQDGVAANLTLSASTLSCSPASGQQSLGVTSNTSWSLVCRDADWLTLNTTSGQNNGTIYFTLTENTTDAPRSATIRVSGTGASTKTCAVTQQPASMTFSPTSLALSRTAQTAELIVVSNMDWTAECPAEWLQLTPTSGEAGNGQSVRLAVNANSTRERRNTTITFNYGSNKATCQVTQECLPFITATPSSLTDLPCQADTVTVEIAANVHWQATPDVGWLTLTPMQGDGDQSLRIDVTANTAQATRLGNITFAGEDATFQVLTVSQQGSSVESLSISGPEYVASGAANAASYLCLAEYSDGTTQTVNPTWNLSYDQGSVAMVNAEGLVTVVSTASNQPRQAILSASYTGKTAKKNILMLTTRTDVNYVRRTLPAFFRPDSTLEVTLQIDFSSLDGAVGYILTEILPEGCTFDGIVSGISPSNLSVQGQTVKIESAVDPSSRTVVYRVRTAPDASGELYFHGSVLYTFGLDGKECASIGGNSSIDSGRGHPADTDGDFFISSRELLAYVQVPTYLHRYFPGGYHYDPVEETWKGGKPAAGDDQTVCPADADADHQVGDYELLDYVQTPAYIFRNWKDGYHWDNDTQNWAEGLPSQTQATRGAVVVESTRDEPLAVRTMPESYRPGEVIDVSLTIDESSLPETRQGSFIVEETLPLGVTFLWVLDAGNPAAIVTHKNGIVTIDALNDWSPRTVVYQIQIDDDAAGALVFSGVIQHNTGLTGQDSQPVGGASVLLPPGKLPEFEWVLKNGWNLIGLPFTPSASSRQQLLDLQASVYDADRQAFVEAEEDDFQTGVAVWIYANSSRPLVLQAE